VTEIITRHVKPTAIQEIPALCYYIPKNYKFQMSALYWYRLGA